MKNIKVTSSLILFALLATSLALAEDEDQEPLSAEVLQELAVLPNNTASVNPSDAAANILESTEATTSGAMEGEITIYRTSAGVDIYNGLNKVESIPQGSDGWVGQISVRTDQIDFTPAGRPLLVCPSQSAASWYGPCKVEVE